eukprot:gene40419-23358_t
MSDDDPQPCARAPPDAVTGGYQQSSMLHAPRGIAPLQFGPPTSPRVNMAMAMGIAGRGRGAAAGLGEPAGGRRPPPGAEPLL